MPNHHDCILPRLPRPWSDAVPDVCDWILAEIPARALLIGGSVVRGGGDPASDLDIQVINRGAWCQRVTRFYRDVPCEIFINPLHRLQRRFIEETQEGRPCSAHMVATAVVVWDPEGLCHGLMTEAKDWLGRKPDQPSPERLCAARYAPATTLEDAEDVIGRDPALAALLLGEALPLILDAYWMAQVRQRPRRKECLDHLQQDDPTAASLMRVALGCGTVRERLDAAGALSQRLMGVRGTFAWTSEREPVPDPDASPRSVT